MPSIRAERTSAQFSSCVTNASNNGPSLVSGKHRFSTRKGGEVSVRELSKLGEVHTRGGNNLTRAQQTDRTERLPGNALTRCQANIVR
eukprot:5389478-Amphidinium_carterae.3